MEELSAAMKYNDMHCKYSCLFYEKLVTMNLLYGYEADESSRGVENQNEELLKDNLNTLVLTSESAEKSCQPLRPKHVRINEKSNVYPAVLSVSAYMKRRRKRGLIDFKKVIQQSKYVNFLFKSSVAIFVLTYQYTNQYGGLRSG
ncbi:unnamed protein product [Trichobilharzia regenti]|nr:unnamed protein product [Trichobilharzia regenti]